MDANALRQETLKRLNEHGKRINYAFDVPDDGVFEEGGWWHVVVEPTAADVRAYEYASILADVEQEMCDAHKIQLVLVPALGVKKNGN